MASHLEKESKEFVKLLMVMEKLRDPENGCPWDLDQTHQSIRSNLLEETYEALEEIDAILEIDKRNYDALRDKSYIYFLRFNMFNFFCFN